MLFYEVFLHVLIVSYVERHMYKRFYLKDFDTCISYIHMQLDAWSGSFLLQHQQDTTHKQSPLQLSDIVASNTEIGYHCRSYIKDYVDG